MIDDGTITIGTEISTKGIKKDLNDLQKELEKYEQEAQELLKQKAQIEVDTSQLDELKRKLKEAETEYQKLNAQREIRVDNRGYEYEYFPEGWADAAKATDEIENQIAEINRQYRASQPELNNINTKLEDNKQAQEEIKKQYGEQLDLLRQIYAEEAADKAHTQEIKERQRQAENLAKKIKRVGLALLGVGSVYGLIRKAAREYMNEHQETAELFKNAWANIMEFITPYIENVVNWLVKMLGYLNVFIKAVTGGKLDLSKKMNKNEKSVKATSKAVKELNKEMASFDEATKLHDNSSLDSGGGILDNSDKIDNIFNEDELNKNTVDTLTNIGNIINKHAPEIGVAAGALIGGSMLAKLGSFFTKGGSGLLGKGLVANIGTGLLGLTAALGTAATAYTWGKVGYTSKKLENQNKSLKDMNKSTSKSTEILNSLRRSAGKTNQTQDEFAITTQNLNTKISDNVALMIGANKEYMEMGFLTNTLEVALKGENSTQEITNKLIRQSASALRENIKAQEEARLSGKMTNEQTQIYRTNLISQMYALQQLREEYSGLPPEMEKVYRLMGRTVDSIDGQTLSLDGLIGKINIYNKTPIEEKKFKWSVPTIEFVNATNDAANKIGQNIAKSFGAAMANLKLQMAFTQAANRTIMGVQKVFGLASGGLINLPGRGVPIGQGVVGGERGTEGILPLTDEAAMETLGQAIGRYVTINANITNTMNGRVISRELQKINNENTFMNNR